MVDSASVLPAKSTSKSKLKRKYSVLPTLPIQQVYSVQVKNDKRKELFALLDKIPEAKAIRACNHSKFDPDGVRYKPPSKPVHSSMFSNPFKFKRGRCREPKKDPQHIKRKEKGPKQTLGLYKQQLCPYHSPVISSLVLPGDELVMVITVDPITVLPSKITSVSPSLVAVIIDEPEPVPNEEAKFERVISSSDADLDEIIKFGSLCSVMIPDTFLSSGISIVDVVVGDPVYHIDLGNLHDDKTVVAGSKSKIYCINNVNTTLFYDDSPRAQMDGGDGVSITNLVSILHNVRYFSNKFKSCVCMHGASSKEIITQRAVGSMRVQALTTQEYLDVKCYYSPHFSTKLLSQVSVIEAIGHPKEFTFQGMELFFAPNKELLDQDFSSNTINLDSVEYNHDYTTCMFTCVHCHKHSCGLCVPGIIKASLCFTQPLIVPSFGKDDPEATVLNSLEKALADDVEFVKSVKIQSLKLVYENIQDKHITLISCLENLPEEYYSLLFHEYFAKTIPIATLNKEAETIL